MPYCQLSGDCVIIREDRVSDRESYFKKLSSQMSDFRQRGTFSDVKIQCKNGNFLCHKFVLSARSKLFKKLFSSCHCLSEDIICQDFSLEAVSKVMELLYTGGLHPDKLSHDLWLEMIYVARNLGLEMTIPDLEIEETRAAAPVVVLLSPVHDSFETKCSLDQELQLQDETFQMETDGQAMVNEILDLSEEESFEEHEEGDGSVQQTEDDEDEVQVEKVVEKTSSEPTVTRLQKCPFCGKTFSVKIALNKHLERIHNTTVDIMVQVQDVIKEDPKNDDNVVSGGIGNIEDYVGKPCPKCDELFRIKDLEDHVKDCQGSMTKRAEEKSPRRVLRDRGPFQTGFFQSSEPDVAKDPTFNFRCHLCPLKFATYNGCIRHIAFKHFREKLENYNGQDLHKCCICDKSFSDLSTLLCHLAKVHQALKDDIPDKQSLEIQNADEAQVAGSSSPDIFLCYICNMTFGRRVCLTRHYALKHFKTEIEKLSFRCTEDCHSYTSSGLNKIIHLAVRHACLEGLIPQDHFVATTTKKSVKKKKFVKKIVPGQKKGLSLKCGSCAKTFSAQGFASHSKHCRPQTGKKVKRILPKSSVGFPCHLCDIVRSSAQMLIWHLAWVHCKDELMSKHNLDASSRACPICNEPILQIQHLLIHLAQKHDQLNSLVDKNVLDHLEKSIQMRRLKAKSSLHKFKCGNCKKIFKNKGALGRHRGACQAAHSSQS